jgi:hypothetical protein
MVLLGEAATGNTPELVVRVREWPSWASEYIWWVEGGRMATPGFAKGLRRKGMAPKAGAGEGCAITAACMFAGRPSRDGDHGR